MKIRETTEIELVIPVTEVLARALAARLNQIRGQQHTTIVDCELFVTSATTGKLLVTVERDLG